MPTTTANLIPSQLLINAPVLSLKREFLGVIGEIVINCQTGAINYLVLNDANFTANGQCYAIPWLALRYNEVVQSFILPISRAKLAATASFSYGCWPETSDAQLNDYLAAKLTSSNLAEDPNLNPSNREILSEIMHSAPAKTQAEIMINTDNQGHNRNPSEQQAYPGPQQLATKVNDK